MKRKLWCASLAHDDRRALDAAVSALGDRGLEPFPVDGTGVRLGVLPLTVLEPDVLQKLCGIKRTLMLDKDGVMLFLGAAAVAAAKEKRSESRRVERWEFRAETKKHMPALPPSMYPKMDTITRRVVVALNVTSGEECDPGRGKYRVVARPPFALTSELRELANSVVADGFVRVHFAKDEVQVWVDI